MLHSDPVIGLRPWQRTQSHLLMKGGLRGVVFTEKLCIYCLGPALAASFDEVFIISKNVVYST